MYLPHEIQERRIDSGASNSIRFIALQTTFKPETTGQIITSLIILLVLSPCSLVLRLGLKRAQKRPLRLDDYLLTLSWVGFELCYFYFVLLLSPVLLSCSLYFVFFLKNHYRSIFYMHYWQSLQGESKTQH
jgi:hypothetical protein